MMSASQSNQKHETSQPQQSSSKDEEEKTTYKDWIDLHISIVSSCQKAHRSIQDIQQCLKINCQCPICAEVQHTNTPDPIIKTCFYMIEQKQKILDKVNSLPSALNNESDALSQAVCTVEKCFAEIEEFVFNIYRDKS